MACLNLYFLGPPSIEKDGVPVEINRRRAIALLTYLAVSGGSHSRDALAVLLWPNHDQSSARADLRRILSALNKGLGEDCLEVDREKVGLKIGEGLWLDVDEFRQCLSQPRTHGHSSTEVCSECIKPLTEAVGLYKGDFLEGFTLNDSVNFDDWQFSETGNLRTEMIGALERLVGWYRNREEFDAAIAYARRWLEIDRADEEAHRQLMEMYAKTGRRTAALRQYEECVRVLAQELSTSPQEETRRLYEAVKDNRLSEVSSPSYKPSDTPTNNLPRQLTSFIGRKKEIIEIKRQLSSTYLLTLTGVGGCGKTRLALEVASDLVDDYKDGVWLVELASLSDPDLVPQEIASALDVGEQPGRSFMDTLSDYLLDRELVLILDNCEHLIEACATLSESLLRACPNLKILATSREGLGISGELTYRVPSLSLPDPQNIPSPEDISRYESTKLFIERALFAQPTFVLSERNAPMVTSICHRLDGIPLAIELAAARVKTLSLEEITARLDDRFRLLTGGSRTALPRQQTLRGTVDWSYNLLSDPEKALLNRLSVFSGGWTLSAAEAVCVDEDILNIGISIHPDEVLDLLTSLAEKSLVVAEETSITKGSWGTRYRLLETVRQYGREKLIELGDGEKVRDLHLDFFLGLAEEAEPVIQRGSDQRVWGRLEKEHDNLRGALEWSRGSGKTKKGLRLAGALSEFWYQKANISEGREWLEGILAEEGKASALVRAKALRGAGALTGLQGDKNRTIELLEESLDLCREVRDQIGIAESNLFLGIIVMHLGDSRRGAELLEESLILYRKMEDKRGIARSLRSLGCLAYQIEADYEQAATFLEESLSLFRELGNSVGVAQSLIHLGDTLLRHGDLEKAEMLLQESLTLFQEVVGDQSFVVSTLYVLGQVAHSRGDYRRATELYKESIKLTWESRSKYGLTFRLEALGGVAVAQNQPERGARLMGAAEALRQNIGLPLVSPYDCANHDRSVATLREQLDEVAFKEAWMEGQKMSMEEAVEYALRPENS